MHQISVRVCVWCSVHIVLNRAFILPFTNVTKSAALFCISERSVCGDGDDDVDDDYDDDDEETK